MEIAQKLGKIVLDHSELLISMENLQLVSLKELYVCTYTYIVLLIPHLARFPCI